MKRLAGIAPPNRAAEQAGGLELAPLARLDGQAEFRPNWDGLQALGGGVVEPEDLRNRGFQGKLGCGCHVGVAGCLSDVMHSWKGLETVVSKALL